jgi:hypothetical protein
MLHGTGAMRGSLRVHSLSELALFVGWSLVSHVRWRWASRSRSSPMVAPMRAGSATATVPVLDRTMCN